MSTIIIADERADIRSLLKVIIEKNGHEVIGEANNGLEARILYNSYNPDLLIIDANLQVEDGLITTKNILEKNPCANILVMSTNEKLKKIAIKKGAKGFFSKNENFLKITNLVEDLTELES